MKPISLLKSGLWITYSTFVNRIFVFLSSLVLARLLQPSDFGVIGIAYVFWSFFTLFTQDTAGAFIVYKGADNPKYVNTTYTVSLLMGLGLGLAMSISSPWIANFFNEPALVGILIAFSFNLLLSSANYVYAGVMTRRMQYQALANISLANSLARLITTTGAAFLGFSYWSFVIGDTIAWIVNCCLTWYYSKQQFRLQIDPEVRSEVVTFCLGSVGSSIGLYFSFNADNFTVGKILGNASLGYYNLAYQLSMALASVLGSLTSQLGMPVFAQLPIEKQENTLFRVVEQIAFLVAPIYALIFLVFDPQVVTWIFSAKWVAICTVLPGLLFHAYFRVVNSSLNSMLIAKGRPDVNARVSLQIAPIAVLSFAIGAYQGGIVGVSLAVALVLGLGWTVLYWWTACRQLHWSVKKFLIPCFVPLLLSVPGIVVSLQLPLIVRPFAFAFIYLLCVRIITPQQFAQFQGLLHQLIDRILTLRPNR